MRMAVLSELASEWQETLSRLDERMHRRLRESTGLGGPRVSQRDAHLLFQHLVTLWAGERPESLAPRLEDYMQKAIREAKQYSSWIDPDQGYEGAVGEFVNTLVHDEEVAAIVEPLAADLARFGFRNSLSQLVLKLTTPGIPDIYQGSELPDLSLVDPDNRRPIDFDARRKMLDEFDRVSGSERLNDWLQAADARLKMLLLHRLLSFRRQHPQLFEGSYRPLDSDDLLPQEKSPFLVAYLRETGEEQLLVLVPRFPVTLERSGGWSDSRVAFPCELTGRGWHEVLSAEQVDIGESAEAARLPFLPSVLYRQRPAQGPTEGDAS